MFMFKIVGPNTLFLMDEMYSKDKITVLCALRYTLGGCAQYFFQIAREGRTAKFILPGAMYKKRGKIAAATTLKAAAGYWTAGRRCEDLFLNFAARSRATLH
jgi:hypothetical protein